MRNLTINETYFVSAAANSSDTSEHALDFQLWSGFVFSGVGLAAEGIFMGYCGHHIASKTNLVRPAVGVVLGLVAPVIALTTIKWAQKIYKHLF